MWSAWIGESREKGRGWVAWKGGARPIFLSTVNVGMGLDKRIKRRVGVS